MRLGLGMGGLVELVGSVDGMEVGKRVSTVMAWKFEKFVKYRAYIKFIFFRMNCPLQFVEAMQWLAGRDTSHYDVDYYSPYKASSILPISISLRLR